MDKKNKYWQLFLSTFKLSACTFGGGFVIIPLMRERFVKELHWIEEEETLDLTAIAQSSPGSIAINASILVGYHVAGIPGALITVVGAALPPLIIISVISAFYQAFRSNKYVSMAMAGMLAGVAAVIFDVVINMAWPILKKKRWLPIAALAACAVAWKFGISGETAAAALAEFHGAGRRLEYKGSFRGADIYDDYAHHPNELHALLQAVRLMHYRRVICAFQPHTYSRTKALFQDFVDELRTVDQAVLADIYAAREQNTVGISSQDLAAEVPGAVYCPRLQDVTTYLRGIAQPGDIILTVGAGDIYKAGEALLK